MLIIFTIFTMATIHELKKRLNILEKQESESYQSKLKEDLSNSVPTAHIIREIASLKEELKIMWKKHIGDSFTNKSAEIHALHTELFNYKLEYKNACDNNIPVPGTLIEEIQKIEEKLQLRSMQRMLKNVEEYKKCILLEDLNMSIKNFMDGEENDHEYKYLHIKKIKMIEDTLDLNLGTRFATFKKIMMIELNVLKKTNVIERIHEWSV